MASNARPVISQKVGVAAAVGAALTGACSSSDSGPEPQTQTDSGTGTGDDALNDLFQDGTPEDIASQLEAQAEGAAGYGGFAPSYKGVTFS